MAVEFKYAAMGKESFQLSRTEVLRTEQLHAVLQTRICMSIEGLDVLDLVEDSH